MGKYLHNRVIAIKSSMRRMHQICTCKASHVLPLLSNLYSSKEVQRFKLIVLHTGSLTSNASKWAINFVGACHYIRHLLDAAHCKVAGSCDLHVGQLAAESGSPVDRHLVDRNGLQRGRLRLALAVVAGGDGRPDALHHGFHALLEAGVTTGAGRQDGGWKIKGLF